MSTTGTTGYAQGNYMSEQAQGWSDRCCGELSKVVDENPTGALLTAFGAGLGIGVALALAVSIPSMRPKRRTMSEEVGHRVLESLQGVLPESISRRFG
ncbi:MAG: hypothetical protein WBC44_14820 [Planctomycetaceae bacterium]